MKTKSEIIEIIATELLGVVPKHGGHDLDYQKFRETILNLISHLDVYKEWKDNHSHSATDISKPISDERIKELWKKYRNVSEGYASISEYGIILFEDFKAAINELTTNK